MLLTRCSSKLLLCTFALVSFIACSKSGGDEDGTPPPPPADVCQGKTITITPTATNTGSCANTGSITVSATGSTGFTYKLNATGVYQSSNAFANIAAGTHTVFVKDAAGCERSATVTVGTSGVAGPLFTAVKAVMTASCVSCHSSAQANGNMNWQVDCNIVANKARIKVRAVDESSMPPGNPLSAADKKKITDWIAAGGAFTD